MRHASVPPGGGPPVRPRRRSPALPKRPSRPRPPSRSVAQHAAEVDATRHRIDVARIEGRLAALEADGDDTDDVGATRRSLEAQLATRRRMDDRMIRLQRQLERTAAQIGEAAAQAEELSVYSPDVGAGAVPLVDAVDGLTAMRRGPRRGRPGDLIAARAASDAALSQSASSSRAPATVPRRSPREAGGNPARSSPL